MSGRLPTRGCWGHYSRLLACLLLCFMAVGCAQRPYGFPPVPTPDQDVRDVRVLPQDLTVYADRANPGASFVPGWRMQQLRDEWSRRFFGPWTGQGPDLEWWQRFWAAFDPDKGNTWGENRRPLDADWLRGLKDKAGPDRYPGRSDLAITVRNTSMRYLPTLRPSFLDFAKPGEGFPFDYNQTSALWVASPVLVSQATPDGAWLYVEADFASGWVPARDVALLTEAGADRYRLGSNGIFVSVMRDGTALQEATPGGGSGAFVCSAHVGVRFPLVGETDDGFLVLVPVADEHGRCVFQRCVLPRDAGAVNPVPTPANLARLGNGFMGDPYGWAGLYEGRDCSSTLRDLMGAFGIWLPRNSRKQAATGRRIDLSGMDAEAKEHYILEHGVPFATVLGMPGHIGLYVGEYQGRAMFFHQTWGLKTLREDGSAGRKIIGKAVVTTLTPGAELPDLYPEGGLLLERIDALTFFTELPLPVAP